MKKRPDKEVHYKVEVWVNQTTESMRRKECLCLNCESLKPEQPDNCSVAQAFYDISVKENTALMVTRCPSWLEREKV